MSGNKVAGGIIALIGAIMALIPIFMMINVVFLALSVGIYGFFIGFIMFIMALIGAILAITGKKSGAIICLVIGIIVIVVNLLTFVILDFASAAALMAIITVGPLQSTWELYLASSVGFSFLAVIFMTFESILILVGGIIATPGSSD